MEKLIIKSKNKALYIIYKKNVYDGAYLSHEEFFVEKQGKNYKRYIAKSMREFWEKVRILGMYKEKEKISKFLGIDPYTLVGADTHLVKNSEENRLALFLSMRCKGYGVKNSEFTDDDIKKEYSSSSLLYGIEQECFESKNCRYITTGC